MNALLPETIPAFWRRKNSNYEVLEGSCAEDAGFVAGDVIAELDGEKVEGPQGFLVIREALQGEGRRVHRILIRRDGLVQALVLILVDYFELQGTTPE